LLKTTIEDPSTPQEPLLCNRVVVVKKMKTFGAKRMSTASELTKVPSDFENDGKNTT
jgi:hypothetical protein